MGAERLTGGRNVLNWDKSSRRRGRNVLKMGAKRLGGGGGRNVYGARCPGAIDIVPIGLPSLRGKPSYPVINNNLLL